MAKVKTNTWFKTPMSEYASNPFDLGDIVFAMGLNRGYLLYAPKAEYVGELAPKADPQYSKDMMQHALDYHNKPMAKGAEGVINTKSLLDAVRTITAQGFDTLDIMFTGKNGYVCGSGNILAQYQQEFTYTGTACHIRVNTNTITNILKGMDTECSLFLDVGKNVTYDFTSVLISDYRHSGAFITQFQGNVYLFNQEAE